MNIDVIILVVNPKLASYLLRSMERNTLLPREVIIIDNVPRKKPYRFKTDKFLMSYYTSKTQRINESWEVARSKLSKYCDYVSFLSDDILIGNWFFQRVYETFLANSTCGVACPRTCFYVDEVRKGKVDHRVMKKREGCAFTIRKELLDRVPPVPYDKITTFHGDDWMWFHTLKLGYNWMLDVGNPICHFVGISVIKFNLRKLKGIERNAWNGIFEKEFR